MILVPDQLYRLHGEIFVVGAAEHELTIKIPLKNLRYFFIPFFVPKK